MLFGHVMLRHFPWKSLDSMDGMSGTLSTWISSVPTTSAAPPFVGVPPGRPRLSGIPSWVTGYDPSWSWHLGVVGLWIQESLRSRLFRPTPKVVFNDTLSSLAFRDGDCTRYFLHLV